MAQRITLHQLIDRKAVSESTKRQYRSAINKITTGIRFRGTRAFTFFEKRQMNVMEWINNSDKSTSTKKGYYIALFSLLKEYNSMFQRRSRKRDGLLQIYLNNMERLRNEDNRQRGE